MTKIRRARIKDAKQIHALIKKYANESGLMTRSLPDIYAQIRDYFVLDNNKKIAGLAALHIYWEDLAEIRSFILEKNMRGKGYGEKLYKEAMDEASKMGVEKVFVLTGIPDFFKKRGYKKISKKKLPHKIWKDCLNCPKFPDCDEEALIIRMK